MKKNFTRLTLLLICCLTAIGANAQNNAPKKDVIIIGSFSGSGDVPSSYVETIRNNVVSGFVSKGRFVVIDSETDSKLKALNSSKDVDASNVMSESHSAAYKSMGAKFIILGEATQYTCTKRTSSEGKVSYKTNIYLSLKGYDIATGEAIVASQLTLLGLGDTGSEADASANEDVKRKINSYINKNFKFQTKIIELAEIKKKKARSLYINAGSEVGIKVGETFLVYKVVTIGGMKTKSKIGKLRAIEIASAHVSKCKVTGGHEEIAKEFSAGSEIIVESHAGGSFLDRMNSVL